MKKVLVFLPLFILASALFSASAQGSIEKGTRTEGSTAPQSNLKNSNLVHALLNSKVYQELVAQADSSAYVRNRDVHALMDSLTTYTVDSIPVAPSLAIVADSLATSKGVSFYEAFTDVLESVDWASDYPSMVQAAPIPNYYFLPMVFNQYTIYDDDAEELLVDTKGIKALSNLESANLTNDRMQRMQQRIMIHNPEMIKYNIRNLPEPPKHFEVVIDPSTLQVIINETGGLDLGDTTVEAPEVDRINWLQTFDASLQFSQAYISPNWYQGGNSALNLIGQLIYNIKLNPAYHPNLLFDTTISYKLGLTDAPDDSIRNYAISQDVLQLNSTLGIKAFDHWYYSVTMQFKTQGLKNYVTNSHQLKAEFLAPGELNVGVGMTYNLARPNFSLDMSLAPLAYNLKMCLGERIDPATFGIKAGHHTKSDIGSTLDVNVKWKIAWNLSYTGRFFAFTDYKYLQADWQNTFNFTFNKYLSTQINVNLRYDTSGKRVENSRWHKLQVKEILSFGFAYKFDTTK